MKPFCIPGLFLSTHVERENPYVLSDLWRVRQRQDRNPRSRICGNTDKTGIEDRSEKGLRLWGGSIKPTLGSPCNKLKGDGTKDLT